MEQGIFLCPFSQRASMTFLFSWLVSFQEDQKVNITPNDLLVKAHQFGLHPTTLKRQIDSFPKNKYFSLQKRGGGYTLSRSSLLAPYLSIYLNPSFLRQHTLSTSEVVLFSAILILKKKGKGALTRKALAGRTGFSLRQVCYSLQSLKKNGLLVSSVQRERYVRHTQEGIIEDTRDRKVYVIPTKHIKNIDCKIAPLKDLIKNPVINNGSLGTPSVDEKEKQSDFKDVWEFYKKNFKQHAFENFHGALNYLRMKGATPLAPKKLIEMFRQVKNTPFLKIANKFGWQEAVVECYGRSGSLISNSSNHVSKYKNHRPGFAWFVAQAQRILRGDYKPKDPSYKQLQWATLFKDNKTDVVKTRTTSKPSSKALEGEIQENTAFDSQEKDLRLSLLKRAGASLYKTWFSNCMTVREEGGTVHLKAPSMFVRDMIQQKILIPLGLSHTVSVAC
jgi:hypothetical protein